MQEKISMFGTSFEKTSEKDIILEVSPNRPDLYSYQGFKRGFLGYLEKKIEIKQYKLNPPEKSFSITIDSSVKKIRPFTVCAIVKGIKFDDARIKEIID